MSKWLNTKILIHKPEDIKKPCHKCGFCPYGQLVEEFPCHSELKDYAIKYHKYVKFIEKNRDTSQGAWTPCSEDDKEATPDINWASGKVKEPYACEVFGHDCPVYYHAEFVSEKEGR